MTGAVIPAVRASAAIPGRVMDRRAPGQSEGKCPRAMGSRGQ